MSLEPIERALCCGQHCGRYKPEHGECQASNYGRRKREALADAGYTVIPTAAGPQPQEAARPADGEPLYPMFGTMGA